MHRRIRHLATAAVVAAIGVTAFGGGTPAQAAAKPRVTMACAGGGFTGWVNIYGSSYRKVTSIKYKIKAKKGNANRRNNDVFVDFSPPGPDDIKVARSGDRAISDNKWHTVREKDFTVPGKHGIWKVRFIFDLKDEKDPRCRTIGTHE